MTAQKPILALQQLPPSTIIYILDNEWSTLTPTKFSAKLYDHNGLTDSHGAFDAAEVYYKGTPPREGDYRMLFHVLHH